ncbi:VACUOLAR ATPASE ASSEMBLY INTEGRAL MEMBRANE PROTEIN VMA21 [Salix viminalis]|uniref:Vacuolar ATPase assembly integral membrane protein VMA21 homolog n=4 Tax=Salix TaxID=40685 RepID=A0A9Q0TNT5_SALVM|nr:VACUOLAR ATPASE ASSEMBLY INTEGRAL MEMBRANE PROTEIN VMA21 [Salix viminalis]
MEVEMTGVIMKFFVTSMLMWIAPVAILYAFNHDLIPGVTQLSPHSLTLLSGFVAVISVNIVIAFYIYMAIKEPSDKHEPDPAFLAEAKASVSQSAGKVGDSSQSLKKEE